ncbi:response regulator [Siminovitchia sp. FSL H7-0308]|uniref:Two-component SAPR family response regulator n=2 Tax=Siminovitchia TaxID=2837510 RepID=A0ABS2R7M9_9BACI|nr:response regulator [Siminovitchia thermophila]MBM7715159.1 two-component SAPR family response regulator [Siminovitchia thermophila]ONK22768.1 hypothetical protein BLX87_13670 [Bacillus sp. VT-16-64]
MRVILIDDESLALEFLEKKLDEIGGIEIIGKYNDAYKGLEEITKNHPDAVFLDIEMPEISGMDLAKKIQRLMPSVKIVFVTAHNEYAVDAFEINAADYIVKPIRQKRLLKTIDQLLELTGKKTAASPMVCCFNKLHFKMDGKKPEMIDVYWRTTKARELFAYLIHHREQFVRKDVLLEYFWPNAGWKDGFTQLYSTVYQIRKTLKSIDFPIKIISSENSYKLELNDVRVDVEEWENGMKRLSFLTRETLPEYIKTLDLYKGDYFDKDDYLWADNERKRLRVIWLSHIKRLADYFIFNEDYTEAILLYLRVQKIQPLEEDSYFMLMQLYDALKKRDSVKKEYTHLKKMLQEEYGTLPREDIQRWYENWEKRTSFTQYIS